MTSWLTFDEFLDNGQGQSRRARVGNSQYPADQACRVGVRRRRVDPNDFRLVAFERARDRIDDIVRQVGEIGDQAVREVQDVLSEIENRCSKILECGSYCVSSIRECFADRFRGGTDCFEDLIEHTKAAIDREVTLGVTRHTYPDAQRTFGIDGPGAVSPVDGNRGGSDVDVFPGDHKRHRTAAREARIGERDRQIPGNSKTVIGQVQVERTGEAEADIPVAVDAEGPGNIDVNDPEET